MLSILGSIGKSLLPTLATVGGQLLKASPIGSMVKAVANSPIGDVVKQIGKQILQPSQVGQKVTPQQLNQLPSQQEIQQVIVQKPKKKPAKNKMISKRRKR